MIISVCNEKGGSGKTTIALNLAVKLGLLKEDTLLIDADPQANASSGLGIDVENVEIGTYQILEHSNKPEESVVPTSAPNVWLIPAHIDLVAIEIELVDKENREYMLKQALSEIKEEYDYIIIDSPPSLGLLTINSFTAADEIIIPLQAQFLAMQGLAKLVEVVEKIKSRLNKGLKIGGVFITQYDGRKVLNRDVFETINEHFKSEVFKTKIRDNIALAEAPAQGMDIFRYNAKSNGAEDYMELAKEILKRK